MGIYILEDNVLQSSLLANCLKQLCQKQHYDLGIMAVTSRPQKILTLCQKAPSSCNLYFLDIKIKQHKTAGFSVAQQIRQLEPAALICFITAYGNLALASYDYHSLAFSYIVKDCNIQTFEKKLLACLHAYNEILNDRSQCGHFIYEDKFTKVSLPLHELYYVTTTAAHRLIIKAKYRELCVSGTLKDLEQLEMQLVRCHQSYLVNLAAIQQLDKSKRMLYLINGEAIPVSLKLCKSVQNSWTDYLS